MIAFSESRRQAFYYLEVDGAPVATITAGRDCLAFFVPVSEAIEAATARMYPGLKILPYPKPAKQYGQITEQRPAGQPKPTRRAGIRGALAAIFGR